MCVLHINSSDRAGVGLPEAHYVYHFFIQHNLMTCLADKSQNNIGEELISDPTTLHFSSRRPSLSSSLWRLSTIWVCFLLCAAGFGCAVGLYHFSQLGITSILPLVLIGVTKYRYLLSVGFFFSPFQRQFICSSCVSSSHVITFSMCPFIWDNNVCMPCLSYKSVLIQQMALFMSMLGNNIGRLCVSFCLIIVLSLWHIQLLTSCLLFCGVYILPDFIGGLLGDFHQFYPVGICGVRIVWRHKCGSSAVLLYVFCLNNPL